MQQTPVYRERPGADAIAPATASGAERIAEGLWMSPGLSNTYMLTTSDGRMIVNTGMGFEAPAHRANFDAVDTSPVRYILLTQGHYDHVGGTDVLRDPDTEIVAQADFEAWQADNARLQQFRVRNAAFAWSGAIEAAFAHARETGGEIPPQSRPEPSIHFEDRYAIELGDRRVELYATPGGETTDSMVVWLPDERTCICGNVFGALFGHIPNLVTMRGDRYRDALEFIRAVERVRELAPALLVTGHFAPIEGTDLIRRELTRLRDAVAYIHDETVRGMNAGADVFALMRDVTLPAELEVGEGYGKVAWNVRAIWETYAGWFHHRSTTELYGLAPDAVDADLVALAGADAVAGRAAELLDSGDRVAAIRLAEMVGNAGIEHAAAERVFRDAHRELHAAGTNFWERAWLREQLGDLADEEERDDA